MTSLEPNDRSASRRQKTVRVVAGSRNAQHRKSLHALNLFPLLFLTEVENRAKESRRCFGSPEVERIGGGDRGSRQTTPRERRYTSNRGGADVGVVLRHSLAVSGDRRHGAKAEETRLAKSGAEIIVEPVAELVLFRVRAKIFRAVQRPADSDLRHPRGDVEAARSAAEVVVDELTACPEAVECPVPDADAGRMHRRFSEGHGQGRQRIVRARGRVWSDRHMLIRFRPVQSALRVENFALAKQPAGIEAHDAAHDSGRYLLALCPEGRHLDSDCSNPRSWSRRNRERVPRQQQAVDHGEAVFGLRARITAVVQALANRIAGSVQSEAIEPGALTDRQVANDPLP